MPASTCRGERAKPRKAEYGHTRGASRGIPARRPEVARVWAALIVFNSSSIVASFKYAETLRQPRHHRRILPGLHVEYKRGRIRRYSKDGRALRSETTSNDTYDFRIRRGLTNFAYLRTLGQRINTRLLHLERSAYD